MTKLPPASTRNSNSTNVKDTKQSQRRKSKTNAAISSRRTEQVRQAQKAFKERKKLYIEGLLNQIQQLTEELQARQCNHNPASPALDTTLLPTERILIQQRIEALEVENTVLRQLYTVQTTSPPTGYWLPGAVGGSDETDLVDMWDSGRDDGMRMRMAMPTPTCTPLECARSEFSASSPVFSDWGSFPGSADESRAEATTTGLFERYLNSDPEGAVPDAVQLDFGG